MVKRSVVNLLALVALVAVAAAWYFQQQSEAQLLLAIHQTREARVRLQQTEQQLYKLANDSANPLLTILGEDVMALQIRVAEFLKRSHGLPDDSNEQFQDSDHRSTDGTAASAVAVSQTSAVVVAYEQSLLTDPVSFSDDGGDATWYAQEVRVLRLDVQIQTAHAPQLLGFLGKLDTVVNGWPVEVRACELHRSVRTGLDARCIVDIYHWAVDDTTDSESRSL